MCSQVEKSQTVNTLFNNFLISYFSWRPHNKNKQKSLSCGRGSLSKKNCKNKIKITKDSNYEIWKIFFILTPRSMMWWVANENNKNEEIFCSCWWMRHIMTLRNYNLSYFVYAMRVLFLSEWTACFSPCSINSNGKLLQVELVSPNKFSRLHG